MEFADECRRRMREKYKKFLPCQINATMPVAWSEQFSTTRQRWALPTWRNRDRRSSQPNSGEKREEKLFACLFVRLKMNLLFRVSGKSKDKTEINPRFRKITVGANSTFWGFEISARYIYQSVRPSSATVRYVTFKQDL